MQNPAEANHAILPPSTPQRLAGPRPAAESSPHPADLDSPKFHPHLMQSMYPKLIQKHVNRRMLNMERALQTLRVPARQLCGRELRRMSELSREQAEVCRRMLHKSAHKRLKLLDHENLTRSELCGKGIEVENPVFDVKKVFALPARYKRRRERNDPVSDFSCAPKSSQQPMENPAVEITVDSTTEVACPAAEAENGNSKFAESELLFREIGNIQTGQEPLIQCGKEELELDLELDKENRGGEEFMELDANAQAPYVAPSFAKVFSE